MNSMKYFHFLIYLFSSFLNKWTKRQILLSKNLNRTNEHDEISVMRFKTYGLYLRSDLKLNKTNRSDARECPLTDYDDGTWCQIEFPSFEDHQSNILSLDIKFVWIKYFIFDNWFINYFTKDYVQPKSIMLI